METRLVIVAILAGCGASATDVARAREQSTTENKARVEAKLTDIARAHELTALSPMTTAPEPAAARLSAGGELVPHDEVRQQLRSASIVELEDGSLQYAVPSNCGGACECVPDGEYWIARAAGGKAFVIHLAHRTQIKTIKRKGSCSSGCGMPPQAEPPVYWSLPVRTRGDITVIEDAVDQVEVVETCDRPIPAP
jgi:hypothetical protein